MKTAAKIVKKLLFSIVLGLVALFWHTNHPKISASSDAKSTPTEVMGLVSDLGVCKEAVDLRAYAPNCTAQIDAVVKFGNQAIPFLKNGIHSENLLMVANCARCLLIMKADLTANDFQSLVNRKQSIQSMMPGGGDFPEIERRGERFFGEHRFAIRSIDELLQHLTANSKSPQNSKSEG